MSLSNPASLSKVMELPDGSVEYVSWNVSLSEFLIFRKIEKTKNIFAKIFQNFFLSDFVDILLERKSVSLLSSFVIL